MRARKESSGKQGKGDGVRFSSLLSQFRPSLIGTAVHVLEVVKKRSIDK